MGMTLSDMMVTNLCGLGHCSLSICCFMMIIDCIISLELSELRVPAHVALGTRAQMSCRWELGPTDVLYSVKWYKDGKEFFRHVPRDTEPRRKFPLPGVNVEKSDSTGSTLVLSDAMFETAGRYRCEVSGERPLFTTVSKHADMAVVELPNRGPVLRGLQTRYCIGDRVRVNCTSGPSRPACQLLWYVNGEPVPASSVPPPLNKPRGDKLAASTSLLDFILTEQHFRKNEVKIKCLATIATLYWQSNEEEAVLERANIKEEKVLPEILDTNSRTDRDINNFAKLLKSSLWYIVSALLVTSVGFQGFSL